jgi:hypothetical protein
MPTQITHTTNHVKYNYFIRMPTTFSVSPKPPKEKSTTCINPKAKTCLQLSNVGGSDTEKVKVAQEAYQELLDGFYEEHQGMMIRQQYEAAKNDPDYFLVLIQLAYHYQDQEVVDNDEE